MLMLALVALAVPAVSVAGGSAGDQQYTDPFGGGSGSQTAPATTTAAASATRTAAPQTQTQTAPVQTSAPSTVASQTAATPSTTAGEPTATMATSSTTLPYTGYDAWTAIGFGLTLVAGGAVIRWRLHARRT
jgi:hypothetical protein